MNYHDVVTMIAFNNQNVVASPALTPHCLLIGWRDVDCALFGHWIGRGGLRIVWSLGRRRLAIAGALVCHGVALGNHCGRGDKVFVRQGDQSLNLLVIQVVPPASRYAYATAHLQINVFSILIQCVVAPPPLFAHWIGYWGDMDWPLRGRH